MLNRNATKSIESGAGSKIHGAANLSFYDQPKKNLVGSSVSATFIFEMMPSLRESFFHLKKMNDKDFTDGSTPNTMLSLQSRVPSGAYHDILQHECSTSLA